MDDQPATCRVLLAENGRIVRLAELGDEVGTALGIAIFGSAFNAGYRHDVARFAGTLPPDVAEPVRYSAAAALGFALRSEPAGDLDVNAIEDGAHHDFTIGLRWAVLVGAALLTLTAIYTALRAPGRSTDSGKAISGIADEIAPVPL